MIHTATAIVAACIGHGLAFNMLKDRALTDPESFDALVTECTGELWNLYPDFNGKGLATMQAAKVPGASKLYGYSNAIRKLIKAGKMAELADLTASAAQGATKKAKGKKADDKADDKPATVPATVDDVIAALQAMHTAGALTAAHYAALASIKSPAPVKAPAKAPALAA